MHGITGFELQPDPDSGLPTHLSLLTKKLMKLCQQHWESLDKKDLAKYGVPLDNPKPVASTKGVSGDTASQEKFSIKFIRSKKPFPLDPTMEVIPATGPRPQSPFKDHSIIIGAIGTALVRPGWAEKDRTGDQFANFDEVIRGVKINSRSTQLSSQVDSVPVVPSSTGRGSTRGGKSSKGSAGRGARSGSGDLTRGRDSRTRVGSKRKAVEPLAEDDTEEELGEPPQFVQGSSTGATEPRGLKRSRVE